MITHIRMKNFKSWKDSGKVELAPLTGFFGTNSSGKSSLLQMLLLLKQTAEHPDPGEAISFGDDGSLVNLGSFREVIHGHKEEETLELEFGCKLQEAVEIEILGRTPEGGLSDFPVLINNFSFKTDIRVYGEEIRIERFGYGFESCDIPEIRWEAYQLQYKNLLGEEETSSMVPNSCYGGPASAAPDVLKPLLSAFEELFSYVYYLGPTRVHPQRHYHWSDKDPTDVGLWGDKVIDALLCAHMRRVKISKKGKEVTIEDRVSEWLREMGLAYSFSLEPIGALKDDNYEVRIQKSETSPAVTLTDIGYGLSDLLPMLVLCYYTPEGSILILEQPGVHLHPMAQAQLADLFLEVIIERNLQILVESHSEHLLTRLQRRVAEKQISQDDVALYFCRNTDGESTIERLQVTESGDIKNWPENFFGDVMGDMFAMTDKQVEDMTQQKAED